MSNVEVSSESVQIMAKADGIPNILQPGLMQTLTFNCQGGVTITCDPRMFPFVSKDDVCLVVLSVVRIKEKSSIIPAAAVQGLHS